MDEDKRRCGGAVLRLRRALLVRAAAKDINLCPEAAREWSAVLSWRSAGSQ